MNATAKTDPWIRCAKPNPAARLRLFCLPYAGGGASLFRDWGQALPDSVEVCAIQLPGREDRIAETPFRQVEDLLPVLLEKLRPYLDRPIAFFGHSMGAFLSYELARALTEEHRGPAHPASARRTCRCRGRRATTCPTPPSATGCAV